MSHVTSISVHHQLRAGRAQGFIDVNFGFNTLNSMGIDPIMLVYGTNDFINNPIQMMGGFSYVANTWALLLIPFDDNLRRCGSDEQLGFMTYSINVPDGNPQAPYPGRGLPLSYINICRRAMD